MKGAWELNYSALTSKIILSLDATRLSLGGAGELEMEMFMTISLFLPEKAMFRVHWPFSA